MIDIFLNTECYTVKRALGLITALVLLVGMSSAALQAQDIKMVDQPVNPDNSVSVDEVKNTRTITGGNVAAEQSGNFDADIGHVRNSSANAWGAVNAAPSSRHGADLTARVSGDFSVRTGNIVRSDVNAIGALNLLGSIDQSRGPSNHKILGSLEGQSFTLSTGRVQGSTVNGIGAFNWIQGGYVDGNNHAKAAEAALMGDFTLTTRGANVRNSTLNGIGVFNLVRAQGNNSLVATQGSSSRYRLRTGNVHNSTVNALGAFNYFQDSGSFFAQNSMQSGTFDADIGNVTGGSSVNMIGTFNLVSPNLVPDGVPGSDS